MSDTPRPELPIATEPPPAHRHADAPDASAVPSMPPAGRPVAMPPAGVPLAGLPPAPPRGRTVGLPAAGPVMPPAGLRPAGLPGSLPPGVGSPAGGDGSDRKAWATDQDVRWCPGCGDYAILAAIQRLVPDLGIKRENTVFVSGIGCSSRFPYYMDTYGFHTIHGRAPAIATGLKVSRPDLDVWVITGDGDALSIGGNHLMHILRRNVDVNLVLFNNQIYGLTKGQYSPTSEPGKVTKSSPYGSLDHPFNPVAVALGAEATFVARGLDRDPKHLTATLRRAHQHRGTSLVEVYQNCNIFNDGTFFDFTEKDTKPQRTLFLDHGQPLLYDGGRRGLRLDGLRLVDVDLSAPNASANDCLVYDETDRTLAGIVGRIYGQDDLPRPFGVIYREDRPTYDAQVRAQLDAVREAKGEGDLAALLAGPETWTID